MKTSGLKFKANLTGNTTDIRNYEKQPNSVVKLNRRFRLKYFEKVYNCIPSKPFSDTCKPCFSKISCKE